MSVFAVAEFSVTANLSSLLILETTYPPGDRMSPLKYAAIRVFICFCMTTLSQSSLADCPCNSNASSGSLVPTPMVQHFAPVPARGFQPRYVQPYGGYLGGSSFTARPPMNLTQPAPPPGTIGQTFKLPSRPVPVEKHPRVGMLDVKVLGADSMIVHDMNEMRTEDTIDGFRDAKDPDIWHFESKPLYPGLEHIYRIQANFQNEDGTIHKEERYVRLIMGRVVELTLERSPESIPGARVPKAIPPPNPS